MKPIDLMKISNAAVIPKVEAVLLDAYEKIHNICLEEHETAYLSQDDLAGPFESIMESLGGNPIRLKLMNLESDLNTKRRTK